MNEDELIDWEEDIWDSGYVEDFPEEEEEQLEENILIEDEDLFDDDDFLYSMAELEDYSEWMPPRSRPSSYSFTDDIVQKESGGNYKAFNPAGGGEGAVGKYQFRWNLWKDKIKSFASSKGIEINTKEDFMKSPTIQDSFYENYYIPREVMPAVKRLQSEFGEDIAEDQLIKLIHFQGEGNARRYLRGELSDKPQSYNSSISQYTGIKRGQYGNSVGNYIDYGITPEMLEQSQQSLDDYLFNQDANITDESERLALQHLLRQRRESIEDGTFLPVNLEYPEVSQDNIPVSNTPELNTENASSIVGLANAALNVADNIKKRNQSRLRRISEGISDSITNLNQVYAEQRNRELNKRFLESLRDRQYNNRSSTLNNVPIWT